MEQYQGKTTVHPLVSKRVCKNDIRMTKQLNAVPFNARSFKQIKMDPLAICQRLLNNIHLGKTYV